MTNETMQAFGAESSMLQTRVAILEAALSCIQSECSVALDEPEVAFSTMCRIASVARQALPVHDSA
jgi:hypothetical protein